MQTTFSSVLAGATSSSATVAPPGPQTPTLKLPETGFLRQPQVLALVPVSKSTLWRRVQARTFPEPVKLSERVTVWRVEDVRQWIAAHSAPAAPVGVPLTGPTRLGGPGGPVAGPARQLVAGTARKPSAAGLALRGGRGASGA